jgi:hypothetical protein
MPEGPNPIMNKNLPNINLPSSHPNTIEPTMLVHCLLRCVPRAEYCQKHKSDKSGNAQSRLHDWLHTAPTISVSVRVVSNIQTRNVHFLGVTLIRRNGIRCFEYAQFANFSVFENPTESTCGVSPCDKRSIHCVNSDMRATGRD